MKKFIVTPVKASSGCVLQVGIKWVQRDIEISFEKVDGKVKRVDRFTGSNKIVPYAIYTEMLRTVYKIYSENEKKHGEKKIIKPKLKLPANIIHHSKLFGIERSRLELLSKYKTYIMKDGRIIIRGSGGNKNTMQPFNDIASAIRAQDHIIEKYLSNNSLRLSENQKLETVMRTVNKCWLFFQNNVKDKKVEENIQQGLIDAAETLEKCRNLLKTETLDQIVEIIPMVDSLDRKNPGALSARTISAKDKIKKRSKNINNIILFIEARKQTLILEEKRIIINLLSSFNEINLISKRLPQISNIDTVLNQVLYLLQSCWVEPYFSISKQIFRKIQEAKKRNNKKILLRGAKGLLENFLTNIEK